MTALPKLLGTDRSARKAALDALRKVLAVLGHLSDEARGRVARVEVLFEVKPDRTSRVELANA